jgi:hypothetical protein
MNYTLYIRPLKTEQPRCPEISESSIHSRGATSQKYVDHSCTDAKGYKNLEYIVSNVVTISEYWTVKDVELSRKNLIW